MMITVMITSQEPLRKCSSQEPTKNLQH